MEVEVHRLRGWGQNKWSFVKILSLRRETDQSLREREAVELEARLCMLNVHLRQYTPDSCDLRPSLFTIIITVFFNST